MVERLPCRQISSLDCRSWLWRLQHPKKGSWDVKGQYFNAKANAPIVDTTYNHLYTTDAKGWMASVDYALQNNVGLSANYGFDWKTQNGN